MTTTAPRIASGATRPQVAVQDDEIREETGRERALRVLLEGGVCGVACVGAQRLFHRDLLRRHPAAGIVPVQRAPCRCGVDPLEGCRRGDVPVAAEGDAGAAVEQAAERVGRAAAFLADDPVGPASVVDGVVRLHAGDDAGPGEPRDVGGREVLRVLDPEAAVAGPFSCATRS
jgi:hypothetical protein